MFFILNYQPSFFNWYLSAIAKIKEMTTDY